MNRTTFLAVAAAGVFALAASVGSARADTLNVDQDDPACDDVFGTPYCTINAAVMDAIDGDIVSVAPGTYVENVVIDNVDISLESTGGRAVTTIQGMSGAGALGTVQVQGITTGVTVGGKGVSFTIIGIDNGSPGIENAAVYFRGNHTDPSILYNEIVANGDSGFTAEFGATMTGTMVIGNEFSGQTFLGAEPGGCGFSQQFTLANVPRQLFVIGGGTGGGNTSDTTFAYNLLSGTAGGTSTVAGCEVFGQGNTLATVDSNGATITGNYFNGRTARFATSLRARGPDTTISDNEFSSNGLIGLACHSFTVETGETLGGIADANEYDSDVDFFGGGGMLPSSATSGSICPLADDDGDDNGNDEDEDEDDND